MKDDKLSDWQLQYDEVLSLSYTPVYYSSISKSVFIFPLQAVAEAAEDDQPGGGGDAVLYLLLRAADRFQVWLCC